MHLRQNIITFDRGGNFQPGVFELRKPRPTVTQSGSLTNKTNPLRQRGPKEKRTYVVAGVRPNAVSEFDPPVKV